MLSPPSQAPAWDGIDLKLRFKKYANRKQSFHLFCPKQELGTEINMPEKYQ
jgi:hypothetical protein